MVGDIPKEPLVSPKLMEAWFRLMAEAMRGTTEAQEALKSLPALSTAAEEWNRWLARFLPAAATNVKPEAFEEWLEACWRMMGVVPRSRYLELLERYELLRSRLEKTEETIRKLQQATLGSQEQEAEVQRMFDLWEKVLKESLQAQTAWMQTWQAHHSAGDQKAAAETAAEDEPDPE